MSNNNIKKYCIRFNLSLAFLKHLLYNIDVGKNTLPERKVLKMLIKKSNIQYVKESKAAGIVPVKVSRRNKKLVPNKKTAFVIFNIPAVKTCPFRTAQCEKYCYALKAEKQYPSCLASREKHFAETLQPDFVERMTYTILKARYYSKAETLVVRIHESGDFYNKAYAEKWLAIMDRCKGEKIKFIAYTKSFPYFDGVKLPGSFSLRFSVWNDTTPAALDCVTRNGWNIYTAVEKFETGDTFTRCRCSDCATCGKCWAAYKDIRCEIH